MSNKEHHAVTQALKEIRQYDLYTARHCQAVSKLSLKIAESLGFKDETFLKNLKIAAVLHDYGKIYIPNKILNKRGDLNFSERAAIDMHAKLGAQLLFTNYDFDLNVIEIIARHHPDQNPIPSKLEDVDASSKIIAVADVFHALTSQRSYNSPVTNNEALDIMRNQFSDSLDQIVVTALAQSLPGSDQNPSPHS